MRGNNKPKFDRIFHRFITLYQIKFDYSTFYLTKVFVKTNFAIKNLLILHRLDENLADFDFRAFGLDADIAGRKRAFRNFVQRFMVDNRFRRLVHATD